MGRKPNDVYEKIAEKEQEIQKVNKKLEVLKKELSVMITKRDSEEMKELFNLVKNSGMSFEDAKNKLTKAE